MTSIWSRYGRQGTKRTGPVGRQGIIDLAEKEERPYDLEGGANERQAHCKVCGVLLPKGSGRTFYIYAANNYNMSRYYACEEDYTWLEGDGKEAIANVATER